MKMVVIRRRKNRPLVSSGKWFKGDHCSGKIMTAQES
jgi:hypothetical protein